MALPYGVADFFFCVFCYGAAMDDENVGMFWLTYDAVFFFFKLLYYMRAFCKVEFAAEGLYGDFFYHRCKSNDF